MKIYQYKYNKIFIVDTYINQDSLVDAYNELFNDLLLSGNISKKKIYQSLNLRSHIISSEPHIVKELLVKKTLPSFKFLLCKN